MPSTVKLLADFNDLGHRLADAVGADCAARLCRELADTIERVEELSQSLEQRKQRLQPPHITGA